MDKIDGFSDDDKRLGRPPIQITERERAIFNEMKAKLFKRQAEISALKLKKDV